MEYSIGDVSRMLNISKEMIRYYEKQGALKPSRKEDNNYRTYSTMDVFFLMEMIRYQAMGLSIKEVSSLLENNYMNNYANYLDRYLHNLQEEIVYKQLLKERIKEMMIRAKASQYNLGKYWFKEIGAHELLYMCNEIDDNYDRIAISKRNCKTLFNEKFAFFESVVLFEEKDNVWYYGINKEYSDDLGLNYEVSKKLDSAMCLCTMIDMGEIGEFKRDLLNPIYDYISLNNYVIDGICRGMIVCRGYQNGKFQRILEVQIPIKTLK